MIWVARQLINVISKKDVLRANSMNSFIHFTWSEEDIDLFASSLNSEEQAAFISDVIQGTSPEVRRAIIGQQQVIDGSSCGMKEALAIKKYFFGASARWLFGRKMKDAGRDVMEVLDDIEDGTCKDLCTRFYAKGSDPAFDQLISVHKRSASSSGILDEEEDFLRDVTSGGILDEEEDCLRDVASEFIRKEMLNIVMGRPSPR